MRRVDVPATALAREVLKGCKLPAPVEDEEVLRDVHGAGSHGARLLGERLRAIGPRRRARVARREVREHLGNL